jgi:hypothetical protein
MSDTLPEWLPELIDTNGAWDEILSRLYSVFEEDFKNGKPTFDGLPVWWDRRCRADDLHEEGFWHLITKDDDRKTGDRIPDFPRAQRLKWCRAVIDNCSAPDVIVFDYAERRGRVRTYLWLYQCDYVVILEKVVRRGKPLAFMLLTAFPLDGKSRRRAMQKKYENRVS